MTGIIPGVGGPRLAWLTSLGLLGIGWVTSHVLSYMLLTPAGHRHEVLAQTGHRYFRTGDLLVLCGLLTLAGIAVVVVRGSARRAANPLLLALLPPVGFVVQEHVERVISSGAFPVHLVTQPRFMVGLALQVPFALAALLCARVLLAAAHRIAVRRVAAPTPSTPVLAWYAVASTAFLDLPRRAALAAGCSERGPPFSLSA